MFHGQGVKFFGKVLRTVRRAVCPEFLEAFEGPMVAGTADATFGREQRNGCVEFKGASPLRVCDIRSDNVSEELLSPLVPEYTERSHVFPGAAPDPNVESPGRLFEEPCVGFGAVHVGGLNFKNLPEGLVEKGTNPCAVSLTQPHGGG